MRHLLLAVCGCLTIALLAAAPAFTIVPTVVVYPPVSSSTTIDRETTLRIATAIANQLAIGNQIKVIPAKAGVERQNFLSDARAQGGDYYVSGFLAPLGDGASLIAQVVSVQSGAVVFSTSAHITTLGDIAGQGDLLRGGILDRASRGIQAFQAPPPPAATPAPQPSNGTDVNVSNLLGRKKRSAPAAPAANQAVAILAVAGSAGAEQRGAAAQALAAAFARDGRRATVVAAAAPSNDVCTATHANWLLASWLDALSGADTALRLIAYDCGGHVAFDRTFKQRSDTDGALATVTNAAVTAYLNPGRR